MVLALAISVCTPVTLCRSLHICPGILSSWTGSSKQHKKCEVYETLSPGARGEIISTCQWFMSYSFVRPRGLMERCVHQSLHLLLPYFPPSFEDCISDGKDRGQRNTAWLLQMWCEKDKHLYWPGLLGFWLSMAVFPLPPPEPETWSWLDSAFLKHSSFLMANSQIVGCSGGLQCASLEVISDFWIQR